MTGARPRVAIVTTPFGEADPAPIRLLEDAGAELVWGPRDRKPTPDEAAALCEGAVAVIAGSEPWDAALLERLATVGVRLLARTGIGLDAIDLAAAARLGVTVSYTPDAPSDSVAELTVGLLVSLARQVTLADREIRAGRWRRRTGLLLRERTIGILGFGRCGSRVARLLRPFGCRLLATDIDPAVAPLAADLGVELVPFEALLPQSEVLTVHVPLTDPTRGLLDAAALARLPQGALLINTARGPIVDEAALLAALEGGHLAGAALDVFCEEPYRGPLAERDDVVLTAHMGSCTDAGRRAMELGAAEAVVALLRGEAVPRRVECDPADRSVRLRSAEQEGLG